MNFEELKLQQQTLTTEQLRDKLANPFVLWDEERRAIEAILAERRIPQADQNYPGFCCQGFDYEIILTLPDDNIGRIEIYGVCRNPDCPNRTEGYPEDPCRGVNSCDLDDFEATLTEKGVKLAEPTVNR